MSLNTVGVLTLILAMGMEVAAQTPGGEKQRVKVGLALSGGSALGLAHIGVLKWFEEHRIPVDYIAGTSMGSLVGGLYATGHDTEEMQRFVGNIDWNAVLAPTVEFRQLAFRRKEDVRAYPSKIEFGVKKGLRLPPGLSAGHEVGLVLSRFSAAYNDLKGFDELPTPFRCVATDINKGNEVVFQDGRLLDALRASMSLPALFAPVKKGDMLLVDGGALNNIPVDVVRGMGADVVIAVALEKPPAEDRYTSLLGVAGRTLSVMITANERVSLGRADLVLMPDLKGLGTSDYSKWEEFVVRGMGAAESKSKMLGQFVVSESEYKQFQERRQARRRPDEVKPQLIEVEGNLAPKRKEALKAVLSADPAVPLKTREIEAELTKIVGMGRFDTATYSFVRKEGKEGIVVDAHEKEYGPPFLKIGFLLDASRQEGLRFGIGGRLTFLDFGGPASEWRSELSIGRFNRVGTEYYHRIKGGKWFVAPRLYYWEDSRPVYEGDEEISDFITRRTGGAVDVGYAFGRFQEFRLGYTLEHARIAVTKGVSAFETVSGRSNNAHAQWAYEGQDNALVPQRGVRATVSGAWLLDYPEMEGGKPLAESTLAYARPLKGKYSLMTEVAGGATAQQSSLYTQFSLGGVGRLDALGRGRLYGNRYYYGGTHVLRSMASDSLSLFGRFYLFFAAEAGKAWYPGISALPRYSGSLGLIGETPFGLVYVGAAAGDQGDRRFFFRLGRVF